MNISEARRLNNEVKLDRMRVDIIIARGLNERGLTFQDIALVMNLPESTVRKYINECDDLIPAEGYDRA